MGSSNISILQQTEFLNSNVKSYYMRRVGSNLIFFKSTVKEPKRREVTDKQRAALQSKRFTGLMSRDVQKKIVQIVQNWDDTIQEMNANELRKKSGVSFQINLLTLTLSKQQHHDDKYIKRWLLVPFVGKLLRKEPSSNYLWKAEPQKNGNIHFHLLIDRYFDKDWIREQWNLTQSQHGYHSPDCGKSVNFGQPSTRIESLKSKNNATAYVAKYVSKSEGSRAIEGRIWGCSDNLRELKPVEYVLEKQQVIDVINIINGPKTSIWASQYGVMINYLTDWPVIQDSLRLNYAADAALIHNINVLHSHGLSSIYELKNSTWVRDVAAEIGEINTLYLEANNQLFPEDWF